jgi:spermidine synthase
VVLDNPTTGIRSLIAQSGTKSVLQSSFDLRDPVRLVDDYTQIIALITSLHPAPLLVFNIGLGGSVLPRFHLNRYPMSFVVSVEIDKVMIDLAKKYFRAEQTNHTIIDGDGAAVLKGQTKRYQVVWIDAFTPDAGVPEVFLTDEFLSSLKAKISAQNLVVLNLWVASPEKFRETVKKYKNGYSNGIIVKIPMAENQILAVGNKLRLTCANFFTAYEAWLKQKVVTVRWPTKGINPSMEICADLR